MKNRTANSLRIGFWNCGVQPARNGAPLPSKAALAKVSDVLAELFADGALDVCGIAEVGDEAIATLKTDVRLSHVEWEPLTAKVSTGRTRWDLAVLSRRSRADCVPVTRKEAVHGTRTFRAGATFEIRPTNGPNLLIAFTHWPTRNGSHEATQGTPSRYKIADAFLDLLNESIKITGNVVALGDFNNDPYDDTVHGSLYSLRSCARTVRSRHPAVFTNLAWSCLADDARAHLHDPSHGPSVGTFLDRKATWHQEAWRAFDHILVSQALLAGRDGWKVKDDGLITFVVPALVDAENGLRREFDHLPIRVAFDPESP